MPKMMKNYVINGYLSLRYKEKNRIQHVFSTLSSSLKIQWIISILPYLLCIDYLLTDSKVKQSNDF